MGNRENNHGKDKKGIFRIKPGKGISLGSAVITMTPENIRMQNKAIITMINHEMGNKHFDQNGLNLMDDDQLTQLLNDMQLQRQAKFN